jgi:hypothetical protein
MHLKRLCLIGVGFRAAPEAAREAFRFQIGRTAARNTKIDLCAP